jgi:lipopolysaccharide export system permease protein
MGSIGRYIFRTNMTAFLITLVSLTVVIWFTQSMRDFDLITSERQTLFVFIGITGMIVPLLVMLIAPIALMIASAHVLSRLSQDSEMIVMNAAGLSPWRLLWPFLASAIVVSILCGGIAAYISPLSLRKLGEWMTQVRADILTNIVQPGRFTTVTGNLTFHISDRQPNGLLLGIFVDDRSNPKEHATYLAEKGEIVKKVTVRSCCWNTAASSDSKSDRLIRTSSHSTAMRSTCRNSAAGRRTRIIRRAKDISGN